MTETETSPLAMNPERHSPSSEPRESAGETDRIWSLPAEIRELVDRHSNELQELIALFVDDATSRLHTLANAFMRQDFKTVRAQAHSMKGAASQMGASAFSSLCAALEASDGSQTALDSLLIQKIREEFTLVHYAMERHLAGAEYLPRAAGAPSREVAKW